MNWNVCAGNRNGVSVHLGGVPADFVKRESLKGPDGVTREYVTPLCKACVEAEKAAEVAYCAECGGDHADEEWCRLDHAEDGKCDKFHHPFVAEKAAEVAYWPVTRMEVKPTVAKSRRGRK